MRKTFCYSILQITGKASVKILQFCFYFFLTTINFNLYFYMYFEFIFDLYLFSFCVFFFLFFKTFSFLFFDLIIFYFIFEFMECHLVLHLNVRHRIEHPSYHKLHYLHVHYMQIISRNMFSF